MCANTDRRPQPSLRAAADAEQIDRLLRVIVDGGPLPGADSDPMAFLTASLQSADLNFGIFDSLTIARRRAPPAADPEEDASAPTEDEEEQEAGAAAEPPRRIAGGARRSGVRRGCHERPVPTKSYDGPSSAYSSSKSKLRASLTGGALEAPAKKQRSSPAA